MQVSNVSSYGPSTGWKGLSEINLCESVLHLASLILVSYAHDGFGGNPFWGMILEQKYANSAENRKCFQIYSRMNDAY